MFVPPFLKNLSEYRELESTIRKLVLAPLMTWLFSVGFAVRGQIHTHAQLWFYRGSTVVLTVACDIRMNGVGGNEMKLIDYLYLISSVKVPGGITAFIDFSFMPNIELSIIAYFSVKHNVFGQVYFPKGYPVLL